MNRNTLLATVVTLLAVPALAGPGGQHREPDFDRLAMKLELEDAQVEQFTTIMKQQHERNQARREAHRQIMDENGRSPELREQMQEQRELARQETRDALSGVLTPDQLSRFDDMMSQRAKRGRSERGRRSHDRDRDSNEI